MLSGDLDLLDFDDEDARTASQVRATLEKAGTPIGAYDLLVAGQALRRGLTVVTANSSEFSRVAGLSWQDWTTYQRRSSGNRQPGPWGTAVLGSVTDEMSWPAGRVIDVRVITTAS